MLIATVTLVAPSGPAAPASAASGTTKVTGAPPARQSVILTEICGFPAQLDVSSDICEMLVSGLKTRY